MSKRDLLFMLPPGFSDHNRREFCPECAELWGLLSWFPALHETLEVHYQPIEKPRPEMTDLLGAEYQNCPTLVLTPESPSALESDQKIANGHRFLDNARAIGRYYAARFGTPIPRGSALDFQG